MKFESCFSIQGMVVDVLHRRIFSGELSVQNGRIIDIVETPGIIHDTYILPGFIDAHIHIESSMLIPSEFAKAAVRHGLVATLSDPHEIANVLGMEGVDYMIRNGHSTPFKFYFGAPSCVPATPFETAGARLGPEDIQTLLSRPEIVYLSEMMNYPGVLNQDPDVMAKIAIAHRHGKPVDGHAPGLRGKDLKTYYGAGIATDHECFTLEEAQEKAELGMKIMIREGSAARNFDALHPIIKSHPDLCMFCSDDRHPDELLKHTINDVIRRSVALGYPIMDVLKIACVNPVHHYKLQVGLLQIGDPADLIVVDNLKYFNVHQTVINGHVVYADGQTHIQSVPASKPNRFQASPIRSSDLEIRSSKSTIRTIEVAEGQLITGEGKAAVTTGLVQSDPSVDLLKLVVLNRYQMAPPAIGFVRNFGLKSGAIASSVAHDSHNIVAIGASDPALLNAINTLIRLQGGLVVIDEYDRSHELPLPVAGLMSTDPIELVAGRYSALDRVAKTLGTKLRAPFMTLSFLALLVIPQLKLGDKGLFDTRLYSFVPLDFPE